MKLIFTSTVTHDGVEHHPGLHDIDDTLAKKLLQDLPGVVRQPQRGEDFTAGKRIDLNAAKGTGPIGGVEL